MNISTAYLRRRPWCGWFVLVVAFIAWPAGALWAQPQGGARVYDEQLRVQLDELPEAREVGFDAGGWLNYVLMSYDDQANMRHRTLQQFQVRGWASLNYKGVHKAYVRGLLNWDVWATNDAVVRGRDCDNYNQVERAWYQFDLGQLLLNQTGKQQPVGLTLKVGREYTTFGTALVLSMPLDVIDLNLTAGDWQLRAMLAKTIKDSQNIDESAEVSSHQDRCFWGFEVTYHGLSNHRPFAYFLNNSDHSTPRPRSQTQRYDYSSRYLGVGSTGSLFTPNLTYKTELVGEWGRTYSDRATDGQDEICAFAADLQMEYLFRVPTRPRIMVEFIRASGDGDRGTSAVATAGGNRLGTRDEAFNAFGFRDTGIAFAPKLSNLNVYVVGAKFYPLEKFGRLFKKLEVGTKVFFYQKDKGDGAISDSTATENSTWLGWEWDIYCDWRLTSDLSWTMRYGAFQPGAAYDSSNDSCRQFLYTGLTLSF